MSDKRPSERIIEQRVRNRVMEELWSLAKGNVAVAASGPTEWFETFFDWFPYEGEPDHYPAMILEEANAVRDVLRLMQRAAADTSIPRTPTVEDITKSGWPKRIEPVAQRALETMTRRGRFSEEVEETAPSNPVPWPPL